MSSGQRVMKALAMAFALFLSITIIGGIIMAIGTVFHIAGNGNSGYANTYSSSEIYTGIESIDIVVNAERVRVRSGNELRVELNEVGEGCTVKVENNILKVRDTSGSYGRGISNWINGILNGRLRDTWGAHMITITVPEELLLKELVVDTGAGTFELQDIQTGKLILRTGAGTIDVRTVKADYADIASGAGTVDLNRVDFQGSYMKAGAGTITVSGKLLGDNRVECGVGSLTLNLEDSKEIYSMNVEKGIGAIHIDGERRSNTYVQTGAENSLQIKGGVGDLNINFSR